MNTRLYRLFVVTILLALLPLAGSASRYEAAFEAIESVSKGGARVSDDFNARAASQSWHGHADTISNGEALVQGANGRVFGATGNAADDTVLRAQGAMEQNARIQKQMDEQARVANEQREATRRAADEQLRLAREQQETANLKLIEEQNQLATKKATEESRRLADQKAANEQLKLARNQQEAANIEAAKKKKIHFVVDNRGTAVRNSASGARQDLEMAGLPGQRTTRTHESGTLHKNVPGKEGPVDIRIMDGQANSKAFKGPRVRTTRSGSENDGVRSDGSRFRNNESKSQRLKESHIHLNSK